MKGGERIDEETRSQTATEARILAGGRKPDLIIFDDLVPMSLASKAFWDLAQEIENKIHHATCLSRLTGKNFLSRLTMQEAATIPSVQVHARDVREAKQVLHVGDRRDWLVINPLLDWDRSLSLSAGPFKAPPTDGWKVRWNGPGESFVRDVTGLKELNAVIAPLFSECLRAKKAKMKEEQKYQREKHKTHIKNLESQVRASEKFLEEARKKLEEARAEG